MQYTLFDWLKYRAPPSQPIKCKTNGNRDLVGRVFPRWTQVTCVNFEFSLVPLDITLSSSWPFVITLVFPLRRAISKIALVEFYPLVVEIILKKKLSVRHEERYVQCLSKTSLKPCARKKKRTQGDLPGRVLSKTHSCGSFAVRYLHFEKSPRKESLNFWEQQKVFYSEEPQDSDRKW